MPTLFPKLNPSPLCLGCRSCFELAELSCTTCKATGPTMRGRWDVVAELGEVFLSSHLLPDCHIEGGTTERPYRCQSCEGSPLAAGGQNGGGHSVDCGNWWNKRAAIRQTGQDGAMLRAKELGT